MLESANKIFHRFPRAKIRLIPFFELGELLLQLFNVLFLRLLALLHSLLERAQIVPQQCILNRQLLNLLLQSNSIMCQLNPSEVYD